MGRVIARIPITKAPVSPSFFEEAQKLIKRYERARFTDLTKEATEKFPELQPHSGAVFRYSDEVSEALTRGYIPPSIFNQWRYCARKLFIETYVVKRNGYNLVTRDQIRSILRGLAIHRLYMTMYAVGETEVKLVSDRLRIFGVADEVRRWEPLTVIEVKSGYVRDPVGAALQVMAYVAVLAELEGEKPENIRSYIIHPGGAYEVFYDSRTFEEYLNRVRTVVSAAIRYAGDDEEAGKLIPPRLPIRLVNRCKKCEFSGFCKKLPEPNRNYDTYFKVMGFTRIKSPPTPSRTLMDYAGDER